jgi:2-methylaconitate cis-trans-isomerase PrpF
VRFGHPSGVLGVGAEARSIDGQWVVTKALMSRSARADGRLGGGAGMSAAQLPEGRGTKED